MEDTSVSDEYEVISEFCCCGNQMVSVRIGSAAHVMSQEEWRKVYGRNHQDRWKKKVDWNRFRAQIGYNKKNVS